MTSSLFEDDDDYSTIERGMHQLSMRYDADKHPKSVAFDPIVKGKSVKRFTKTRSRKKTKKSQLEQEPTKNTFANLMSSGLLPKKAKKTQKHCGKETRSDFSPSSSSHSSGTYASVDDVIATLQKMMNRDGDAASEPNNPSLKDFSRERVGSDHARSPSKGANVSSRLYSQALENRLKASYLQTESSTNDDLTSISSTTSDTSSQEYSYVLQPNVIDHSKQRRFDAAPKRPVTNYKTATNVDLLLHQLSGEHGYMALTGRNYVGESLDHEFRTHHNQCTVDTTYDNVNKLMEAYRQAAAKDAMPIDGDVRLSKPHSKSTSAAKYPSKPEDDRVKQRCAVSSHSSTETTPFHAQSSMKSFKLPRGAFATADSPSCSRRSYGDDTNYVGKTPPTDFQDSDIRLASKTRLARKPDLRNPCDWLSCRETDIVDYEEGGHVTPHRRAFDVGRTSQVFLPILSLILILVFSLLNTCIVISQAQYFSNISFPFHFVVPKQSQLVVVLISAW